MKKTQLRALLLLSSLLLLPISVYAEFKIATVDLYKIVNESKEAKEKRVVIEKISNDAKKKFEAKKVTLNALEKTAKEGGNAKDTEKLRNESKELARFVHDTDEELQKQIMKTNKELGDRAAKIIEDYAKSQNIDLVLYKGSLNRGSVLYGTSAVDITEEILKRFDTAG